jgi:hypothetical protein
MNKQIFHGWLVASAIAFSLLSPAKANDQLNRTYAAKQAQAAWVSAQAGNLQAAEEHAKTAKAHTEAFNRDAAKTAVGDAVLGKLDLLLSQIRQNNLVAAQKTAAEVAKTLKMVAQ